MRLPAILLLVTLLLQPAAGFINFITSRILAILRTDAVLGQEYVTPLAMAIVLGTLIAGQYGFLPVRTKQVVKKLQRLHYESHLEPPHRRHRRALGEEALDWLLQTLHTLDEATARLANGQRTGGKRSGTWK
ncbi:uncharacterized protein LOC119104726 [Pollicipes pollicipes]|uniref:uncharacterized protein LOC119104726 n=1 Tax=Pollicipes pollicipes TaxID=41117 RepID=UPI0018849B35|nr:uncharacterized protein LOC119104726 [Pollicipes pollicipes]